MVDDLFRTEFELQRQSNFCDWQKLVQSLDEDTLLNGCISDGDVTRYCFLLEEKALGNDEFLYSLLATFWSLPKVLKPDQAKRIGRSIRNICGLRIQRVTALILLDALLKISPDDFTEIEAKSHKVSKIVESAIKIIREN